jgi:hypothetical protein
MAMELQEPTEFHAYEYHGPLRYLENRSHSMALTPNHRMMVRPWNERMRALDSRYVMRPVNSLGWYSGLLAAPRSWQGVDIGDVTVGDRTYAGDDFIALLSLVVADGWAGGSESTRNKVSFCAFRTDKLERARALAARVGFSEYGHRPGVFAKSDAALANYLRANAYRSGLGAVNKSIPLLVKCASERQIRLFLDYYGDKCSQSGTDVFSTVSPQLADDLQELLLRIGHRSGVYKRPMRGTVMRDGRVVHPSGHTEHSVRQWSSDNLSLERDTLSEEPYHGMVYCATVPNSTLITRRHGKTLISGNSCATESTSQALEIVRAFEGQDYVELNPWFMYHTTSGGRDNGSNIDTNLEFVRDKGVAPESIWPRSKGWRATPSADAVEAAKLYRIEEFYDIATIEEIGTALLLGFPVVFGWQSHSCVLTQLLDTTTAEYANSWSPQWGDQGFGKIKLSSINFNYGAFAVRTAAWNAK